MKSQGGFYEKNFGFICGDVDDSAPSPGILFFEKK